MKKVTRKIKTALDALSSGSDKNGYKRRDGQIKMINDIRNILASEHSKVAVCEAGTGIGKTLAYLLSVVPTAQAQRKSVVISTATVALQEQILQKDLPLFQTIYPDQLTFVVAKGKGRFVCLERLKLLISSINTQHELDLNQEFLFEEQVEKVHLDIALEMSALIEKGQWDGDRDSWKGKRLPDFVWNAVASDQHQCKSSFKNHKNCPYHKNREEIFKSNIVVANHALFARDLELGGGVLIPSANDAIYVFDEAHQLPDILRSAKASTINCEGFISVLDSIRKVHASRKLTKAINEDSATTHITNLDSCITGMSKDVDSLAKWSHEASKRYLSVKPLFRFEFGQLPNSLKLLVTNLKTSIADALSVLNRINNEVSDLARDGNDNAESALSDLGFFIGRLTHWSTCLHLLIEVHEKGIQPAKWIEKDAKGRFLLGAGEVSIGSYLKKSLWDKNNGVVLTSATLRSLNSFNDFARDVGLDYEHSAFFRQYSSPFNYGNSQLVLPKSIPFEPNSEEFKVWLKTNIFRLFEGYRSSLVLFTSKVLMEEVRSCIEHTCTTNKVLLQCQGDAPRQVIIENHQKALSRNLSSVVFGLDSFSEGLDLKGELLENLIITRIPFEMPDSPIVAALMEYEKWIGNLPFYTVTLPAASRALMQSVGRLIRTENDSGRCIILDKRIITKRYGAELLEALPPFSKGYF